MKILLLSSNVVVNIVECDAIPEDNLGYDLALEAYGDIGIGYIKIGQDFHPPIVETLPQIQPEYPTPVHVPELTSFQAKAALSQMNLLNDVEAYIADADTLTQLRWQEAGSFRRDNPTLITVASALNLTETQIDTLFEIGAGIIL
jgi:hypothetical protein